MMLDIDPSDLVNKGDEQDYDIFQRVSQMTGEPLERVRIIGDAVIADYQQLTKNAWGWQTRQRNIKGGQGSAPESGHCPKLPPDTPAANDYWFIK